MRADFLSLLLDFSLLFFYALFDFYLIELFLLLAEAGGLPLFRSFDCDLEFLLLLELLL